MATNYPGALDTLTNPASTDRLTSPSHAAQHANANDAIEAIQATLGTNPQGSESTVSARIAAVEAAAGVSVVAFSNSGDGTVGGTTETVSVSGSFTTTTTKDIPYSLAVIMSTSAMVGHTLLITVELRNDANQTVATKTLSVGATTVTRFALPMPDVFAAAVADTYTIRVRAEVDSGTAVRESITGFVLY